jgi:muramoyltetrapeptide carboxypeptidase
MTNATVRSPKLVAGDLVRLVSPASYPPAADVGMHQKILQSWGLRCDTGDYLLHEHGYMAGTDAERLTDLNNAFKDPAVRAIIAIRGGAGAYRIADDIDFAAVATDPKPLIGFSDISSLQLALFKHCQLGSVHGCLWGNRAQRCVRQLLMTTDALTLHCDPNTVTAGVQINGTAQGRLIGGNLQAMANAVGVRMPSMRGAIVFIEYHREAGLGTVDRYLTQLIRSGTLDGIAGVVLGSFEGLRGHTDRGWTISDVLYDRLALLNGPVLGGIYAGHDLLDAHGKYDQDALPLGAHATLDVAAGTLTVESVMC